MRLCHSSCRPLSPGIVLPPFRQRLCASARGFCRFIARARCGEKKEPHESAAQSVFHFTRFRKNRELRKRVQLFLPKKCNSFLNDLVYAHLLFLFRPHILNEPFPCLAVVFLYPRNNDLVFALRAERLETVIYIVSIALRKDIAHGANAEAHVLVAIGTMRRLRQIFRPIYTHINTPLPNFVHPFGAPPHIFVHLSHFPHPKGTQKSHFSYLPTANPPCQTIQSRHALFFIFLCVVPTDRFELSTYRLKGDCTASCAMSA